MKALKVLVLLVSISAASVLVWYASRNTNRAEQGSNDTSVVPDMQVSSESKANGSLFRDSQGEVAAGDLVLSPKFGIIIETEDISEVVESSAPRPKVTDEEVKRTRDAMLSTSKSGRVMSDDKIREMLEGQKKEALKQKSDPHLMSSSKKIDSLLLAKDLKKIVEGEKKESKEEVILIPSSKSPIRLLDPKDVEQIVEDGKSDFVKPQEPKLTQQEIKK
jgi:hypothetical protein